MLARSYTAIDLIATPEMFSDDHTWLMQNRGGNWSADCQQACWLARRDQHFGFDLPVPG
jgi:hypothetical protein